MGVAGQREGAGATGVKASEGSGRGRRGAARAAAHRLPSDGERRPSPLHLPPRAAAAALHHAVACESSGIRSRDPTPLHLSAQTCSHARFCAGATAECRVRSPANTAH